MKRAEARELVGKKVIAWTAANGVYVGILETLTSNTPWRGKVKIIGVVRVATPLEKGRINQRKGFRPGDTIEVGHSSVKVWNEEHKYFNTYLEALQFEYDWMSKLATNPMCVWFAKPSVEQLQIRIKEEETKFPKNNGNWLLNYVATYL